VQTESVGEALVSPAAPTRGRRDVAGVIVAMVSAAIAPFLVGTLSVQIGASFEFGAGDLAVAVAGYYLVSAVLSPAGGRLVGALGAVPALRLACLGSTAGLGLAATADSASTIVIALGLLGVPNALVQPASNQVLATVRSPRLQALSFGLVQSAIPIATLISGVLLGLVGASSSWRAALVSVVVFTALGQLVIGADREKKRQVTQQAASSIAAEPGGRLLLTALVVGGLLATMAAATLPAFVAATGQANGVGPHAVAAAQIAGSMACITARVAITWRAAHLEGFQLLFAMAGLLALGAVGYLLVGNEAALVFGAGVVLAYGCGWGWNGVFNLSLTRARPRGIARATGLTQAGVFLGGVLGPLMFAAAVHRQGHGAAWGSMAVVAVTASVLLAVGAFHWQRVPSLRTEYEERSP